MYAHLACIERAVWSVQMHLTLKVSSGEMATCIKLIWLMLRLFLCNDLFSHGFYGYPSNNFNDGLWISIEVFFYKHPYKDLCQSFFLTSIQICYSSATVATLGSSVYTFKVILQDLCYWFVFMYGHVACNERAKYDFFDFSNAFVLNDLFIRNGYSEHA